MEQEVFWMLSVCIAIACYTDWRNSIIPNRLTFAGAVLGFSYHGITGGLGGLVFASAGFAAGFLLLLALYAVRGIGAGDVKMFGAIGAITGVSFVLQCLMYSIFFGALIGAGILLSRQQFIRRAGQLAFGLFTFLWFRDMGIWKAGKQEYLRFPFMYAVLPGCIIAVWLMPAG
ncbi:A24 family peptidase [Paenibacillus gansuensis]|uniref:Prepilin peptidase n=1 Tax=Paenibacillus gansuensis TaxID=306542 RepID=A0ABW5PAP2_9BACL